MGVSKTSDHIPIKVKVCYQSQEHPAFSKFTNQDLKDTNVLCTFKIQIESQYSELWCIKDYWPYINQDQDAKPQSGTSSVLHCPKSWLEWHKCSLHLQNQERVQESDLCCIKSSCVMAVLWPLLHISEGRYGCFMPRMCPMLLHEIWDMCESILVISMIEKSL